MTGFTYPKDVGGQGGEAWQERIYDEEAAQYEASSGFIRSTIVMLGPTLMAFGTDEQQRELDPPPALGRGRVVPAVQRARRRLRPRQPRVPRGARRRRLRRHRAEGVELRRAVVRPRHAAGAHEPRRARSTTASRSCSSTCAARASRSARSIQATGAAHFNEVFFEDVRVPVSERARRDRRRLGRRPHGDVERVGDDRRLGEQHVRQAAPAGAGVRPHRRPGRTAAPRRLLRAGEGARSAGRPHHGVRSADGSGRRSTRRS